MSLPCLLLLRGQPEVFIGWSCGLMDKALVLGTKDCRLESCQDQECLHHESRADGRSCCRPCPPGLRPAAAKAMPRQPNAEEPDRVPALPAAARGPA